jgi:maleate cis-trans isomerase
MTLRDPERRAEYGGRGTIGLILGRENACAEAEMRVLAGADIGIFCARLPADARSHLERRLDGLDAALAELASLPLGVAAVAVTDAAYAAGPEPTTQLTQALERYRSVPVLAATQATGHALDMLQARRIAVVSSCTGEVAEAMTRFYAALGLRVIEVAHPPAEPAYAGHRPSTAGVLAAARSIDAQNVDAILIADADLPSLGAVDALLDPQHVPVVSVALCLAWCCVESLSGALADHHSLVRWLADDAPWRMRLGYEFPSAVAPRPSIF